MEPESSRSRAATLYARRIGQLPRDLQALMGELSLSSLNVHFIRSFFRRVRPVLNKNARKRNCPPSSITQPTASASRANFLFQVEAPFREMLPGLYR